MRIALIVSLLCIGVLCQDDINAMNDMLRDDVQFSGPGVRARVTPAGTAYVASVVARALTNEVAVVKMPSEPKSSKLNSLPSVTFSQMHLQLFEIPSAFNVMPVMPNLIAVELRYMNLSVATHGVGVIGSVAVDSAMDIRTNRFTLDVRIKIGRNSRGNPHLKVDNCKVPPRIPVTVVVAKALTPESGAVLAGAIAEDGHSVFEQIICPRLTYLIETRVNQRFGLLSTKISLGETNNFDLVRSLLRAEDEQRRSIRQNSNRQRDIPMMSPKMRPQTMRHQRTVAGGAATMQNRMQMRPQTQMMRNNMPGKMMMNRMVHHNTQVAHRQIRRDMAGQRMMVRSPRGALHTGDVAGTFIPKDGMQDMRSQRVQRQDQFHTFLNSFNLSRADALVLDYGMLDAPFISMRGIEIAQSGEISTPGMRTPFGARPLVLPSVVSNEMLQIAVSDFVPNTLMYHGHRSGLFNTRVDPNTPQFGSVMRTTCDLSTGSLFCVGDLFPTLRDMVPNRGVAFLFSTLKAPAIAVRPESQGGIKFQLVGLISILAIEQNGEVPIGSMEIHIDATMKMRMTSKSVRGKVNLEDIRLISRTPQVLVQEELDDAGFLSREILQRMVNDILRQGIPIPVHPLFKLQKPKLTLMDRSMLLETSFQLNQNLIRQLTTEKLVAV